MTQPPLRRHDLWPHQTAAFHFAYPRNASLLAMGLGTGKSCTAIALSDNLNANRVLILCPTTVRGVWRRGLAKHSARDVEAVILDSGTLRKRVAQAECVWTLSKPVVVVINYEAAWRDPFREWCLGRKWDLAILDEGHGVMKLSRTARFARELHDVSERRLSLSGTPLTQDPLTIWAQCRFLDPNVFGEDLDWFINRFHNPHSIGLRKELLKAHELALTYGVDIPWEAPDAWTCGIVNREEYMARLARVAFRVEIAVLELPPLTVEERTFRLSDTARRIYDELKANHDAEIETGRWVSAQMSYSVKMRLQQITSGWLRDQDGKAHIVDAGKAELLRELLEEAGGEPVVVFSRFVKDLDTVRETALELGLFYGEISQRRKDGVNELAQMPDRLQVCGVQEQAGGVGIDLTRARIAVFYSLSWSRADFEQAIARLHRPPATRPIIVYELIAEGSIDEELYVALSARKEMIDLTWHGLAERKDSGPSC
jgi:SNF2 family DNA or RNA helicase